MVVWDFWTINSTVCPASSWFRLRYGSLNDGEMQVIRRERERERERGRERERERERGRERESGWWFQEEFTRRKKTTLLETNIAPEHGRLEYSFPLGEANFSGAMVVLRTVGVVSCFFSTYLNCCGLTEKDPSSGPPRFWKHPRVVLPKDSAAKNLNN